MTSPMQAYLRVINKDYAAGNATEHTYRPALKKMVEEIGNKIKAVNEPKRIACGAPDFVIMREGKTGDQTIGYIEAKDIGVDLGRILKTDQLKEYRASLPSLILTDYIDFLWFVDGEVKMTARLAEEGRGGTFTITEKGEQETGELLRLFLQHEAEPIKGSKELAGRLAATARLMRDVIEKVFEQEGERGGLHGQYEAFREVLIHDMTEKQFADMYAQTICYGLFAARCHIDDVTLYGKDEHAAFHGIDKKGRKLTREHAAYMLPKTNPFLRKMFGHIAGADLDDRIAWLVDETVGLLSESRMDLILQGFAKETGRKDPVIHFYETFLAAYDPKLRESRGVYYTPEPVVSYIVRSVDYLLRTRFGLRRGLAEEKKIRVPVKRPAKKGKGGTVTEHREMHKVLILDPATGTGTFLFEVIQQIYKHFARNQGAWSGYVREHLLPRLFGFELMMAPYAMAHMKLGLELAETGYDFASEERLGIYLTNTLEEAEETSRTLFAQWLSEEAAAANEVKRDLPIMVVLGNPPYSGLSVNMNEWIDRLLKNPLPGLKGTQGYYEIDGNPLGEKKVWLQDDYVKFMRFAQWKIENAGHGILAFITNHGYLDNPTFRGMRQSLMKTFDEIYVINLHGNSKKKEICPDGSKDENVFDIQQGVAIGIFIKGGSPREEAPNIYYSDLYGLRKNKYEWLDSNTIQTTKWSKLKPNIPYYFFVKRQEKERKEYEQYESIEKIFQDKVTGIVTARDAFVIDFDENRLLERISDLRDDKMSDEDIRKKYFRKQGSTKYIPGDSRGWKLPEARKKIKEDKQWKKRIKNIMYRPFDARKIYYTPWMVDWGREEIMANMLFEKNIGFSTTRSIEIGRGWEHVFCSRIMIQHHSVSLKEVNYFFPLYLYRVDNLFENGADFQKNGRRANINEDFLEDITSRLKMGYIQDGFGDLKRTFGPEDILGYIYGVFHSPSYRKRYAEFLKIDFPRVPWPEDKKMFVQFSKAGRELIGLHLLESDLLEEEKRWPSFPAEGENEVMNGYPKYIGKAEKPDCGRVYINEGQYFEGVEPTVWEFSIGGYQVCERWLKDRRGRKLTYDEIRHYQKIAAALRETGRIMGERYLNEPWEDGNEGKD